MQKLLLFTILLLIFIPEASFYTLNDPVNNYCNTNYFTSKARNNCQALEPAIIQNS